MLKLLKGLTETVVKTATLPVTIAADVVTLGGVETDKKGDQTYTGDMLDSIGRSLEEMTDE